MIREVTLTDREQTWDCCLQFIVNPDTTHCVVNSWEYHHWLVIVKAILRINEFTRINVSNLFIHIEQVTITLTNFIYTKTLNRLREVKEYSKTCIIYTKALIATLLCCTRCNITWHKVTESWVTTLQIIVSVLLRNFPTLLCSCLKCLSIFNILWNPNTTIITQRF